MRFLMLFAIVFVANNTFSQQIDTTDIISDDSLYLDADSLYYDGETGEDYYEYDDAEKPEYKGYIMFVDMQVKKTMISKPVKFNFIPYGFDFGVYKQIQESLPFFLGGTISLDFYGTENYEYLDYGFENGYEYQFSDDFTAFIVNVDMGGKYFSKKSYWFFNPYVQLDLEYRYAYAVINTVNLDLDETTNTEFEKGNSGIGYNFGLGSLVDISSKGLFLNFSINYTSGGGLFLYNRKVGNYDVFSVLDNFDYKYFPIGFLTFKVGVAFSK